jgi:hypothetical protein
MAKILVRNVTQTIQHLNIGAKEPLIMESGEQVELDDTAAVMRAMNKYSIQGKIRFAYQQDSAAVTKPPVAK